MQVFSVGAESARGLDISTINLTEYERHWYLLPDTSLTAPDHEARVMAANAWKPLRLKAAQSEDFKSKAYFQDALDLSLPGCCTCVSENARTKLEPSLGDQVKFLPIDLKGAPMPYWALYATRFYSKVDLSRSRIREPAAYISDRRLELREPYFLDSSELDELFIFRVAGAPEYVPFALGDYVTQRFVDLVTAHSLGGFSFMRLLPHGEVLPPGEARIQISRGPKYKPAW